MKPEMVAVERWVFGAVLTILGFLCVRELSRLSSSIDTLALTQREQNAAYQDLRTEFREFKATYAVERLRFDELAQCCMSKRGITNE